MIADATAKSNSDYSLRLCYWLLNPIGAWPPSLSTTKIERFISFALIIICYGFMFVTIIPSMLHLFLEHDEFMIKMKLLGPVGHWCIGCVNYTTLLLRSKEIRYCANYMKTDWRKVLRLEDQQVMMKNAKFGQYIVVFYALFMHSGLMCHCCVYVSTTQVIQVGNESIIVRLLPCVVYKELIDVNRSPVYEILVVTQFLSATIVNTSAVAVFSLLSAFAAHACGQLGLTMMWITEYVNGSSDRGATAPLKNIGEWNTTDAKHLAIYFLILTAIFFNTFVICYIGELLAEQCEKVGQVVYMTDWYHLPEKRIADLILIIARSNIVVHLTAWKLMPMSVYTFGNVMKSAFAYMNLLVQSS